MSPLVILEISGLFFNTWTADEKYSFGKRENLPQPIDFQLSKKLKSFSQFFIAFLKSTSNFQHFEKNMSLIADAFSKVETANAVVT